MALSAETVATTVEAAAALRRYEAAIAEASEAGFALGTALRRAEAAGGRSPLLGRRIFAAVSASQAQLDAAMTHAGEAHRRTVDYADELGIPPSSYGEQTEPQEDGERRVFRGG